MWKKKFILAPKHLFPKKKNLKIATRTLREKHFAMLPKTQNTLKKN
jgi:hypothetical protein